MYQVGDILISKNGGIKYRILETGTLYMLESVATKKPKYLGEWVLDQYFIRAKDISFKTHVQQFIPPELSKNEKEKFIYLVTGLIEESGEVMELMRRNLYKSETIKRHDMLEEIGDVLFFLTAIASEFNINYNEVKEFNIDKLNKRFPKGFWTKEDAIKKVDHDE